MVAMGDIEHEGRERERMVELSIEHGWIQKVAARSVGRGHAEPVVILATVDCDTDIGPLGEIVKKAVASADAMPAEMRRIQDEAGCQQFVVFSVPLAVLCEMVDPDTADDLRGYSAHNEYAVLCMNADHVVLVSGVSSCGQGGTK